MTERQIKAYGFVGTMEFIDKNYDPATRQRILDSLTPETRRFIEGMKKAQWAPPLASTELWAGITRESGDPQKARDELVKTGRHMGSFATNTYLKLLMKMLTIKMFAKKIPDIWARDANFGKVIVDLGQVDSQRIRIDFKDLGAYPYFGPVCQGWFAFSLETMGIKNVKVELENFSMENPDPGELTFRVTWTK
jgi:hypothetical protein